MMSRYYDARSRSVLLSFVDQTFREQGKDVIARDVLKAMKEHRWDQARVVVSGFRTVEEIELVRRYCDVVLLGIDAAPELRFARSQTRHRPGTTSDYAHFLAKDMHEWAWGLSDLMGRRIQQILSNESTFPELFRNVESALGGALLPTTST